MGNCKDCEHLKADKYAPSNAAGRCVALSTRYGADIAWSEIGNQFLSIYVGPMFGCIQFKAKA